MKLTVIIYLMVIAHTLSQAQNGGLDNTFGNGGIVSTPIGVGDDICRDIAVQGDDKIVLVGSTFNGTNTDLAVLRYNKNGTIDNTFGEDGVVSINLGGDERGTSVVILPDGKILTAGSLGTRPNSDFLLYKFNTDGTVDMTFGMNGRVSTDFGGSDDVPNNVLLTPTGKILVTGDVKNGDDQDYAAAQYNADGTPDLLFSTDGRPLMISFLMIGVIHL